jgi:HK97 gp10 family phage protein
MASPGDRVTSFNNVTLRSSIPEISSEALAKAAAITQVTALEIQKEAATRSRVDTGNMRSGWRTRKDGTLEWTILNEVNYTAFHEFGTRYISPQPMLVPAVERMKPKFFQALEKLFSA